MIEGTEDQCRVSTIDQAYERIDVAGLREGLSDLDGSDKLYGIYRLYPISKNKKDLESLPSNLEEIKEASAADYAVLSALWAFKSRYLGSINWIRAIRRSDKLLKRALSIDSKDPIVSLIHAQSLMYRPKIAGGSKQDARDRLITLKGQIAGSESCSLFIQEVDVWIWKVTKEINPELAESLKSKLLSQPLSKLNRRIIASDD